MSHLVKKECSMSELDTLLHAAQSLGWDVKVGGRVKFFNGEAEQCTYVLTLHGELNDAGVDISSKYNIGVQIGEDKKITLLHDDAMNGRDVMSRGEHDPCTTRVLNKLKQSYQICAARKVAQRKGWRVSEQKLADGRVVLRMNVR